ncbi:MAG: caspase family protein [Bacteroidaceae bacterium]|uniref:caspase family protein n=1 Tax=Prevotella sp. MA2016 TaxID=1408310 RepID=UPI0006890535|nr:caspase family protein [Prevotella sp. MA2016]MBR4381411.1 caspase family protein [Bacteroidaceae bacterium]
MKRILFIVTISIFTQLVMAQNKRALLVGISDYQCVNKYGGWNNIHGKNDIDMLCPTLKKWGASVSCLYDKGATKTGIDKALKVLISQCKTGDIVYLHFSTHGQPFEDESGDEDDGWDESIVPVDAPIEYTKGKYEGENHLIDDELHEYCTRIRKVIGTKGMLYVVIDACHAGKASMGIEDDVIRGTKAGFTRSGKYYRPQKLEKGNYYNIPSSPSLGKVVFIEACRSHQVNKEIVEGGKHFGALSYYINRVLSNHELSKDSKWIGTVKEMMEKDPRLINQNLVMEYSK